VLAAKASSFNQEQFLEMGMFGLYQRFIFALPRVPKQGIDYAVLLPKFKADTGKHCGRKKKSGSRAVIVYLITASQVRVIG